MQTSDKAYIATNYILPDFRVIRIESFVSESYGKGYWECLDLESRDKIRYTEKQWKTLRAKRFE